MKTYKISSEISIAVPDTFLPPIESSAAARGGTLSRAPQPIESTKTSVESSLSKTLSKHGFKVKEVVLTPQPTAVSLMRSRSLTEPQRVEFNIDATENESVVLLVQQDDLFTWCFPEKQALITSNKHKRDGSSARHTATFKIDLKVSTEPKRLSVSRGFSDQLLFGGIKAFVLKFAAKLAAKEAMRSIEEEITEGIIKITSFEASEWKLIEVSDVQLPETRPPKILLFIHGTFSSTVGSFGSVSQHPAGRKFLEVALTNYDAVLGYDHKTLSKDPLRNAEDLLILLSKLSPRYKPTIDVVAYSRGGLVYRSLTEHLLPKSDWQATLDRAVFVACTNAGTALAEPANWKALLDLYTNLSVAACRLISSVAPSSLILAEALKGASSFVKYLVSSSITDGVVPGIAAMQPKGRFVTKINEAQVGQPMPTNTFYYVIRSNFDINSPGLDKEKNGLPKRMKLAFADFAVDSLMKEANDLVVNIDSMIQIDPAVPGFIKDVYDFGTNSKAYHTNYFLQEEVAKALIRWLKLVEMPATFVESALPAVVRSASPAGRAPRPLKGKSKIDSGIVDSRTVQFGTIVDLDVPTTVDTNVLIVSADTTVANCLKLVKEATHNYVVMRRGYHGRILDYAYDAGEFLQKLKNKSADMDILTALGEHEDTCSNSINLKEYLPFDPNAGRSVVRNSTNDVVGVLSDSFTKSDSSVTQTQKSKRPASDSFYKSRSLSDTTSEQVFPSAKLPSGQKQSEVMEVFCNFMAQIDSRVQINRNTSVELIISRETIEQISSKNAKELGAAIDPAQKLMVKVVPILNFSSVGPGFKEIDPPAIGVPQTVSFTVRGTNEGEGEIWVVIVQGQVPVVTLVLRSEIQLRPADAPVRKSVNKAASKEAIPLSENLHQLRIWEKRNGSEISYGFNLQSPDWKVIEDFESKPITADRAHYIAALYKEIETYWISNNDDVNAFAQDLRAFGGRLFDSLIPDKLQKILWDNRDGLKKIWVTSTEPFIPWELVHLKEPGQGLPVETCFLGQLGLIRWLHGCTFPPSKIKVRENLSRYVIPDYPDPSLVLTNATLEAKFLKDEFSAREVTPHLKQVNELIREAGSFDLLHFACHGETNLDDVFSAKLALEGRVEVRAELDGSVQDIYIPEYLSAITVGEYANLTGPDGNRPLVTVNACQAGRSVYELTGIGGFAKSFLNRGAGAFIGALWSVGDSPARDFIETFYSRLKQGADLATASIDARESARKAGDATWLAYVVYGYPSAKMETGGRKE